MKNLYAVRFSKNDLSIQSCMVIPVTNSGGYKPGVFHGGALFFHVYVNAGSSAEAKEIAQLKLKEYLVQ